MIRIEELALENNYHLENGVVIGKSGRPLKLHPCSKGYLRFNVFYDGKTNTCWLHRLVAFIQFGERLYKGTPDVRHIDGNKLNNDPGNIRLGSRSKNLRDTPAPQRTARANRMNVTKHSKLWAKIDLCLAQGKTAVETAAIVGCWPTTVRNRSKKLKTQ